MTDEELIKLSRENLRKSRKGSLCECYDEAFIKGYRLAEKRIAELKRENAGLKAGKEIEREHVKNNAFTSTKEQGLFPFGKWHKVADG